MAARCSSAASPPSMRSIKGSGISSFLPIPTAGELRIGTPAGTFRGDRSRRHQSAVAPVSARCLSRRHQPPGVRSIDQLRERNIEIGFDAAIGLVGEEDIDLEVLYDEPLVVVAGVDNPWVRRRKIKLAELVNEPWTWPPPGSRYDSLVVEAFRASGLEPPRPAVYTHAINLRISLAATGPFLAVVAAGVVSMPSKYPSIRKLPVELPTTRQRGPPRHPQEADAEPTGATVYRLRTRYRQIALRKKIAVGRRCHHVAY